MSALRDAEWHGWAVGDVTYYVTKHDYRKQVMLARSSGGVFRAVAYFRDEDDAADFLAWVDQLADVAGAADDRAPSETQRKARR